jgi:prepilin-type N-terminal cleavage/methylation domain-containing protein
MMRRTAAGTGRAGFTLIELLVVIAIIAVLIGLLMAAVMQVLGVGPKADTIARLTAINSAMGTFKSERSAKYIPAGQVDINPTILVSGNPVPNPNYGKVIGPFRLRNSYRAGNNPGPDSFEASYIASVFGSRVNLDNLGNPAKNPPQQPADQDNPKFDQNLDANQTLLFFLNGLQTPDGAGNTGFVGFSANPQAPFTPVVTQGESRKGPYLELTRKRYEVDPSNLANGFARLVDGYGTPFAYFVAYNGKVGYSTTTKEHLFYGGYNSVFPTVANNPNPGIPLPYQNGGKYANEAGFQIISAGKDKVFKDPTLPNPPAPGAPLFLDWNALDKNPKGDSQDNLANFSTSVLASGPK